MAKARIRYGDRNFMIGGVEVNATADEIDKLVGAGATIASGTQAAAIAAISNSGTYATDEAAIETAINSIIAALVAYGIIAAE